MVFLTAFGHSQHKNIKEIGDLIRLLLKNRYYSPLNEFWEFDPGKDRPSSDPLCFVYGQCPELKNCVGNYRSA